MVREIKFRAWDKENKQWIVNDVFLSIPNGVIYEGKTNQGENVEIQMYTGLKDKNGKEIYEGDVVEYTTRYFGKLKTDNKQKIKWIDDMEHDGFGEPVATGFLLRGDDWEIIGDIYSNPELLKP